jgi:hypothetical protein
MTCPAGSMEYTGSLPVIRSISFPEEVWRIQLSICQMYLIDFVCFVDFSCIFFRVGTICAMYNVRATYSRGNSGAILCYIGVQRAEYSC